MPASTTATQTVLAYIHSFISSFQSRCLPTDSSSIYPSLSIYAALPSGVAVYLTTVPSHLVVLQSDQRTPSATLESTLTAVWRFMRVNSFEAVSINCFGLKQSVNSFRPQPPSYSSAASWSPGLTTATGYWRVYRRVN